MEASSLQRQIEQVLQLRSIGRLAEAESVCRQVASQLPAHAGIVHLLGLLNHQLNRNDVALELIRRAIKLNPIEPDPHGNLAAVLLAMGRADESIRESQRAIALRANYPEAYLNLGNALKANGQTDDALAAYRTAIQQRPDFSEAQNNLANVRREKGELTEAVANYRRAIAIQPAYADAHYNLGVALTSLNQSGEAIEHFRHALALQPTNSHACFALANTLHTLGRLDEAVAAYRQAISLQPESAECHNNLGAALQAQDRFPEAIACYQRASSLAPGFADPINNMGTILRLQGRPDEAIAQFRRAVELSPDHPQAANYLGTTLREAGHVDDAIAIHRQSIACRFDDAQAHVNLGYALLLKGNFENGLPEYEWRLQQNSAGNSDAHPDVPQWDGQPLGGRRILIRSEQGLGDSIQLVRYIPMVAQAGGEVILECYPELATLFEKIRGVSQLVREGEALPAADYQSSLLSLPFVFKTTLNTIPAAVPYIHADPAKVGKWRDRLARDGDTRNIGVVWAGRPTHRNDTNRSISMSVLSSLGEVRGIRWISLQKDKSIANSGDRSKDIDLIDWTAELHEFADTAALVYELDLVITVDTSVAHLAGAMGRPVWVLLPFAPDFRWLLDRSDTPWYPTMRLFRQPRPGDWECVLAEVMRELRKLPRC